MIDPFIKNARKKLCLPDVQKFLLIWDDFSGHKTVEVLDRVREINGVIAEVPKNLTNLLAPLDLTLNKSLKSFKQREWSKYYSDQIAKHIRNEPQLPIEDAKVDVRLSVIKPLHAKTMAKAFTFFSSTEGKKIIASGWRGAGIAETIERARSISPIVGLVDPFQDLTL